MISIVVIFHILFATACWYPACSPKKKKNTNKLRKITHNLSIFNFTVNQCDGKYTALILFFVFFSFFLSLLFIQQLGTRNNISMWKPLGWMTFNVSNGEMHSGCNCLKCSVSVRKIKPMPQKTNFWNRKFSSDIRTFCMTSKYDRHVIYMYSAI